MGLAAGTRAYGAKAMDRLDDIVRTTILRFSDSLVTDWTPLGDPVLWKHPAPADYVPGNLRSSWFYSVGAASGETTERTDVQAMNGLERMPAHPAGEKHYLSNSARHATSIEAGHSSQAPVGIMWAAMEFEPLVYRVAAERAT